MRLSICFLTCFIIVCNIPAKSQELFHLSKIVTGSLFQSKQEIYLLSVDIGSGYMIDIGYSKPTLLKTSEIAKKNNALAAINGSFYNVENGGSVTYFEKNGTVISHTKKPNSLLNGIIILSENNEIKIEAFKSDLFYEKSQKERFAIATGPILVKDSILQKLPDRNFTNIRHPRTCLCRKKNAIVFVVVDGRNDKANGMNLFEAQKYLLSLGCIDAINLDGGGSSTMWVKNKGIVNTPSDIDGERAVSNALLLIESN